ncbi:hypothetical protein SESBI_39433 [Sesbania bispinosa]|nr:hypothetical protein SESBI_39433 [Sesbania bispinosa]
MLVWHIKCHPDTSRVMLVQDRDQIECVVEITGTKIKEKSSLVTLILHHGGKFERNEENELDYTGGEVDVWEDLDSDLINRFLVIDLCKLHKYHMIDHCYWLSPEKNLEDGLRELRWDCDTDVLDMCEKEGAENVKESDQEGVVNQQNDGGEETNKEGRDIPAEDEQVWNIVVEDDNDQSIPEKEDGSKFSDDYESVEDGPYRPPPIFSEDDDDKISDEEVVVDRGSGSNIRRKRAQNSDDIMSGDETDSGSEKLSDHVHDEDGGLGHRSDYAEPVENFEGAAGPLPIDDSEVDEDNNKLKRSSLGVETKITMLEIVITMTTYLNLEDGSHLSLQDKILRDDNNSQAHVEYRNTCYKNQPYKPPALISQSAARPHARQPADLRYRPPPVRGVTSQPQVQEPIPRPASVVDPMGTNMTFMPTPGYRAPPPPNS